MIGCLTVRSRGCGFESIHSALYPRARHINYCLALVPHKKIHPTWLKNDCLVHNESNQTNIGNHIKNVCIVHRHYHYKYGPRREKACLRWFANNKGADQPAHPHSMISVFVIHLLERVISKLAASEILMF